MKKIKTLELSLVALAMTVNVVGTFIAFTLKLPILLDSIGTILITILLGPTLGVISGLGASILSGITFDIYSLYFAPVQVVIAITLYVLFKYGFFKGRKLAIGILILSIVSSLAGAIISAFIFDGVTSSGSSYIVAILSNLGVNKVTSVFLVQFLTDLIDKSLAISVAKLAISEMPRSLKGKLVNDQ